MMILTAYNYCAECGTYQEPEDKFCKNCGHSNNHFKILNNNAIHCPSCAIPIASDYKYCPTCGSRTEIPSTVQQNSESGQKGMTTKEINQMEDIINDKRPPGKLGPHEGRLY